MKWLKLCLIWILTIEITNEYVLVQLKDVKHEYGKGLGSMPFMAPERPCQASDLHCFLISNKASSSMITLIVFPCRAVHHWKTLTGRLFGGQVVGQALVAASHTVSPHLHVHSLHCYFIKFGKYIRSYTPLILQRQDGGTRKSLKRLLLKTQGLKWNAVFHFHSFKI